MRIDTLEIANFRGFATFRRRLGGGINVLVGENGAGKTALLDALAVGVGSFFLGVDGVSARAIERDDVRLVSRPVGDTLDAAPQYPVELTFEGEAFGKALRWSRTLGGKNRKTTHAGAAALSEAVRRQVLDARAGRVETFPLIAYHGTGRLWMQRRSWGASRSKRARSRLDGYASCLEAASDEKGFLNWLRDMEWTEFQEHKPPLGLVAVRETIRGLVPGCVDLRYRSREAEAVAIFDDGRRLPTRLLSDGFRTVVGLAADLAWRCATLNPHLGVRAAAETPGVVLVDEIDLHLHPNWQRRIVDDLRRLFPRVQFFLTTHSPFIVQSLRAGEVIPLSGPAHLDKPPFKSSVEEVATDVLGVDDVQRSARFREMQDAADQLILLLDRTEGRKEVEIEEARKRYLDLVERYNDDPAYLAVLKAEGAVRGVRLAPSGDKGAR